MKTLTLGLKVSTDNNRFALFESCGQQSKVIDDRTILADILGKFDVYVCIVHTHMCQMENCITVQCCVRKCVKTVVEQCVQQTV